MTGARTSFVLLRSVKRYVCQGLPISDCCTRPVLATPCKTLAKDSSTVGWLGAGHTRTSHTPFGRACNDAAVCFSHCYSKLPGLCRRLDERGHTWQWCESSVEQGTGQMPLLSLSSASTAPLTLAMTSAMLPTADTLLEQSAYFLPRSLQDVGPSVTGEENRLRVVASRTF